jgi:hypothetical protein
MFSLTIQTSDFQGKIRMRFICQKSDPNSQWDPNVFCYQHKEVSNFIDPDDPVSAECIGMVAAAQYHSLPTEPHIGGGQNQFKYRRNRATFVVPDALAAAELKEEILHSIRELCEHLKLFQLHPPSEEIILIS